MEYGLSDTDSEAARVHLALLQSATPQRRLRLALSLSRTVMSLSKGGLARTLSDTSPQEIGIRFVAQLYGSRLAEEVRADLAARRP